MLALKNGRVLTMAGKDFEKATILVENGKILDVGSRVTIPEGAEVIDVSGMVVMPGIIDAHAHLGIYEEGIGDEGEDTNEMTDPVTPHLRAIDAVNPEDKGFEDARENGITAVLTGPGSANVIGGEQIVIKTAGRVVDSMVVKNPAGLKVAFGENPKRVYQAQKKTPSTRMATAALLRENLVKAQNYMKKLERGKEDSDKEPDRDLKMESLVRVLKGEIPLRAHAHRADDIMTAVRIAEEFNVKIVIEHCTEGHKIADELAKRGIPAVVGPSLTARVKVELKDRTFKTPGILAKAGVTVALMTDHPVIPVHYLPLSAALAVRDGMDEEEALKAITINPARICGVDDRLGSLEKGKDADIVVFDRWPLDVNARVKWVIIDGKIVHPS
ncbi:Dihydroorotase [Koleobacter methoxysyntrophicus]|uniref:Dihydroorotase n=1 Tax=Koleobacter methoxysyntrophicus TaxID=2751313 RepID=A0A8A0RNV0_9FIRM|nr:amidohydrolase [Koleobacter methoxysyntrophicus]QSQ09258.1 Dihydroorotase [Koleobacter methoxysyntrophicus]